MVKEWKNLSESSKKTLGNTAKKLFDYGYTAKEVLEKDSSGNYVMSDKELKKTFDFGGRGYSRSKTFRRQVRQITFDLKRKQGVKKEVTTKFTKFTGGKYTKRTNRLLSQFNKTVGLNTFYDIAKKVQKEYNISKKASYKKTRLIIDQYWSDKNMITRNALSKKDKAILSFFS